MILADKIINERKKNGWSQEELAEKLEVSRQSVSKWESAQSVPDINRIIKMAEIFGVTTDYLLKDEAEPEKNQKVLVETMEKRQGIRCVDLEETSAFLKLREKQATLLSFCTSLCIVSPACLILFAWMSDIGIWKISEDMATGIGIAILLALVAIAVAGFIKIGNETKKYGYLEREEIETAYGVDGLVKEKYSALEPVYNRAMIIGVVLCIISVIPLIVVGCMAEKEEILPCLVVLMLNIVAIGVNMIVKVNTIKGSYDRILQEGDYTVAKKKRAPVIDAIDTCFWMLAAALYLGMSFLTQKWEYTWVIWPVAALLHTALMEVAKIVMRND